MKNPSKNPSSHLLIVSLTLGLLFPLPRGNAGETLLENPDFESGQTGWKLDVKDPNTVLELVPEAQSPFGQGTNGLHIRVQEGADGAAPFAIQELNPNTNGGIKLAFDFKINADTTYRGRGGVLVLRLFNSRGAPTFQIVFRGQGDISLNAIDGSGKYEKDVWYHAELETPAAGADPAVTLSLTPEGGRPEKIVLEGWQPLTAEDSHALLQIQPDFGVRPTTDVYLDNVQVMAVEEKRSAK